MLEGRLDDLSLPDLFQLLALTNKTGTLRMRYGDTAGAVIFREGQIVGAFDDVRRTAPGTRMLAAGLIDDAQLEAALDATEHQDEGGVIAALVAQGAVDETTVAEFRRQQAEDAVFALMRLSEATFSLETGEVPPLAGEVELNTEQLVVEGGRRLSEWAEIRRRVPGRQSVPSLVPDPPGEGPVTVGRQQWRLLALVDGRRTVGDLVDLLGSGEYATSAELSGLVDAGLISVGDRASHATGVRSRGERLRELETRELGLLRDDPAETPETVAADASAHDDDHEDGEDHAATETGDGEAVAADAGDASEDGTDADAGDEAGDGDAGTEAEEPAAEEPAAEETRPAARRSPLAPTLVSGVELGDDGLTAGQPLNGDSGASADDVLEDALGAAQPAASAEAADNATVPDASDVAAEALGSAVPSAREEDEAGEPAASDVSDDAAEPAEAEKADEAAGPAPLPAAPPQPTGGEPASTSAQPAPADDAAPPVAPLGNELPAAPGARPAEQSNGDMAEQTDDDTVRVDDEAEAPPERRLTRDEDINKAMLLRLIDGVKGV